MFATTLSRLIRELYWFSSVKGDWGIIHSPILARPGWLKYRGDLALRYFRWHASALAVAVFTAGIAAAHAEDITKTVTNGAKAIAQGAASVAKQTVEAIVPVASKPKRSKSTKKSDFKKIEAVVRADGHLMGPPAPAGAKLQAAFPVTVPEAKAAAEAEAKPPETWSEAEVADAKARCAVILKKISAIAIPEAPIKQGACGTPAPIQLISIGRKPEVSISPPAIMTCELAEALSQWLHADLQPLAKKHLGAEIIKIENMSSYACRNAYGRTHNKLSEHGIANALDIRGFTTAAGKTALVLEDWGTPQREILARIAAEKAAADKAAAERAAAEKAAQAAQMANKSGLAPAAPPSATASSAGGPAAGIVRSTIIDGVPKVTVTIPGAKPSPPRGADPAFAISEPDKLGGPKLKDKVAGPATAALPVNPNSGPNSGPTFGDDIARHGPKAAFLQAAHAAACRTFGTTLGPEANSAHRNHFHVDMAHRKSTTTKICD